MGLAKDLVRHDGANEKRSSMTTTAFPSRAEFGRGQEYVHSVSVRTLDGAAHELAASFRIALVGAQYVLSGVFFSQECLARLSGMPAQSLREHVHPLADYLLETRTIRENFRTYSEAKRYVSFYRSRANIAGRVLSQVNPR